MTFIIIDFIIYIYIILNRGRKPYTISYSICILINSPISSNCAGSNATYNAKKRRG